MLLLAVALTALMGWLALRRLYRRWDQRAPWFTDPQSEGDRLAYAARNADTVVVLENGRLVVKGGRS